jgi:hypothetical protein
MGAICRYSKGPLTIVGGDRERPACPRRRRGRDCAPTALDWALLGGPSTSPLGVMTDLLRVEPSGESSGRCDCCGNETRTIWGHVRSGEKIIACYFLQWTRHAPKHFPNLDFLVGTWGDDSVHDRKLVSWLFIPAGPSFRAIDSATRPAAKSPLCAKTLTREDVIHDSNLMDFSTELIDAVWLGDPRVQEVKELANDA